MSHGEAFSHAAITSSQNDSGLIDGSEFPDDIRFPEFRQPLKHCVTTLWGF